LSTLRVLLEISARICVKERKSTMSERFRKERRTAQERNLFQKGGKKQRVMAGDQKTSTRFMCRHSCTWCAQGRVKADQRASQSWMLMQCELSADKEVRKSLWPETEHLKSVHGARHGEEGAEGGS
jgi:hypothetical protein